MLSKAESFISKSDSIVQAKKKKLQLNPFLNVKNLSEDLLCL